MKRFLIPALIVLVVCPGVRAELASLSHLYSLGKTIHDLDGDGLGEKIALSIIIPDNPTSAELALATDIAARANLESLSQDFGLVRRESEVENWEALANPILIGSNVRWARDIVKDRKPDLSELGPDKGVVFVFSHKTRQGIALIAGSDSALLKTGRAFFLRWPYFWEIWGRENGATYMSFESDLAKFLGQEEILLQRTSVREATYEFPPADESHGALRSLEFNSGEITNLLVEINFTDEDDQKKAYRALELLKRQRSRGQRTGILAYPACARITFDLRCGKKDLETALPRPGSTKRLLTPAFKENPRVDAAGRDFDLTGILTAGGIYADRDQDGILDGLETSVVIPAGLNSRSLTELGTKLVLPAAGASFPIVYLDSEIEQGASLTAPILVGANKLTRELIRKGKLVLPPLESAWGLVRVVPTAFNATSAIVVDAADAPGLDKTLAYLSETFPYFDDYREGRPRINDVPRDFQAFLRGEKGGAEAYFDIRFRKLLEDLKDRDLESLDVRMTLPKENRPYLEGLKKTAEASIKAASSSFTSRVLRDSRTIFEKEKEFEWEADEALAAVGEALKSVTAGSPVKISVGVSESPEVRQKLKGQIERALAENKATAGEIEVQSAYKQGYFWITEKILPLLKGRPVHQMLIRFAQVEDSKKTLKRSYEEPGRWLEELYPADEVLSRELQLPLERIEFESRTGAGPVYEILALDEKGGTLLQQAFSPRTTEIPFLDVLPEWGRARITTGWVRVESGQETILDRALRTDLERFWEFYQQEVLKPVTAHVLKKTGYEPTFAKQPYFKRLLVELWASEPDFKTGLDEEAVSSLEAIHDEIYFDTLDLLRGITGFEREDGKTPEDTSRSSAPGNVLPVIHRSTEGGKTRVRVSFEDWTAQAPEMEVRWKEKDREEFTKTIAYPEIKVKNLKIPAFIFNGQQNRMETLSLDMEAEKESDYLTLLELMESYRQQLDRGQISAPFGYPGLRALAVRIRWRDLEKEEVLPVVAEVEADKPSPRIPPPTEAIVPTDRIISPEMCADIVDRLAAFKSIRAYTGGKSFEGRPVPVLEIFTPVAKYVSLARLVTFKPTLEVSSRQHANEISSTNYSLKLAELLARDKAAIDSVRKINFVIQPMENPDGAALAYELAQQAPFHSLHAGRYGTLGVDIGYAANSSRQVLPEALVRAELYERWLPDIYLNLHGYPSHEWVQPFSNYSPYLFRDYRIPRGWFVYSRSMSLPIYERWKTAGDELMGFITQEIQADERIRESNRKLYDRYNRWASRWQPFLSPLEITDGVNIYAKRQSSQENRLTFRSQVTFVEETPELMDETATGGWLSFLCEQGLAYLRAHIKYLSQVKFETSRIEEEVRDRIRIEFHRSRPGAVPKAK
jgi:hypothetical protein